MYVWNWIVIDSFINLFACANYLCQNSYAKEKVMIYLKKKIKKNNAHKYFYSLQKKLQHRHCQPRQVCMIFFSSFQFFIVGFLREDYVINEVCLIIPFFVFIIIVINYVLLCKPILDCLPLFITKLIFINYLNQNSKEAHYSDISMLVKCW